GLRRHHPASGNVPSSCSAGSLYRPPRHDSSSSNAQQCTVSGHFGGLNRTANSTQFVSSAALCSPPMVDVVASVHPLAPATGDPVFGFRFDWPARVGEIAAHLLAYGAAYLLGQRRQRLASRSAAAFKGSIISVE